MDSHGKRILDLVEDIYNTIEHPACWQSVLKKLVDYIPESKATLTIRNNESKSVCVDRFRENKAYGLGMKGINDYVSRYYREDAWIPIEAKCDVGEICRFSERLSRKELAATGFFKGWLQPNNISDGVAVQLFKCNDFRVVLNVFFPLGEYQEEELLHDLGLLLPHLRKACSLWMKNRGMISEENIDLHLEIFKEKYGVTPTELEFLLCHIRIGTAKETARKMGISQHTAYTYTKRIKEKLGVPSILQAVLLLDGYTHSFE
jgi:DNA-binding CsgD family transcriptional regulator